VVGALPVLKKQRGKEARGKEEFSRKGARAQRKKREEAEEKGKKREEKGGRF
jgi:hypothetical protein